MEPNNSVSTREGVIREFPIRTHGLRYRPVASGDADFIVAHISDADRHAVFPFSGPGRLEVLLHEALGCSALALAAATPDGEPVALVGLIRLPGENGAGSPWMVSTGKVRAFRRALLTDAKQILAEMRRICPYLINFVHVGSSSHLEWLRRLGFTVYRPEPFGADGALHHRVDMHDGTRQSTFMLYNYLH